MRNSSYLSTVFSTILFFFLFFTLSLNPRVEHEGNEKQVYVGMEINKSGKQET